MDDNKQVLIGRIIEDTGTIASRQQWLQGHVVGDYTGVWDDETIIGLNEAIQRNVERLANEYLNEYEDPIFGKVISRYTRAQAIEDGVLVDANSGAFEAGSKMFKHPVAMTSAVYDIICKAVDNPNHNNDFDGVWWDIIWMAQNYAKRHMDGSQVLFKVIIVGAARKRNYILKLHIGPGDFAEPVITVMLPDED